MMTTREKQPASEPLALAVCQALKAMGYSSEALTVLYYYQLHEDDWRGPVRFDWQLAHYKVVACPTALEALEWLEEEPRGWRCFREWDYRGDEPEAPVWSARLRTPGDLYHPTIIEADTPGDLILAVYAHW